MFVSFFPMPRMFFWSAFLWTLAAVLFWFFVAKNAGHLIGLENLPEGTELPVGVSRFWSKPFIWFYIYFFAVSGLFYLFWRFYAPHPWQNWSIAGTSFIVFIIYYQVEISVAINAWYGEFYDLLNAAINKTRVVAASELYNNLASLGLIILPAVFIFAFARFFFSHYVFRWRNAMNDYYVTHWQALRHVEGASQRVQDDAMRFADNMETLGIRLVDSLMTLIAFLPILVGYSKHVKALPLIGEIPHALVFASIFWSLFGTGFLALVGIRLPGLEFRNQRVEAAFRKELVYGEDAAHRAEPATLKELFDGVRRNYFILYFNYLYFNVARRAYSLADTVFALILLVPSVVAGALTLGLFNQISNAFDQVRESFQYIVNSWPDVVKLMSIYKRLRAFEATIHGDPLAPIEAEPAVV